jgi:HK97 family phage portal protein
VITLTREGKPFTLELRTGEYGTSHLIPRPSQAYGGSVAGVMVNDEVALSIPTFNQGVRLIAEGVAALPTKIIDTTSKPHKTVTGGALVELFEQPDTTCSAFDFWADLASHVELGNAYVLKLYSQGRIAELALLDPCRVMVEKRDGAKVYTVHGETGRVVTLPASSIIHVRGWTPTGAYLGDDPAVRFREAIGETLARSRFATRYMQNDARPGVVITHPSKVTREVATDFLALWNANMGGPGNAGKTGFLSDGMTIQTLPTSLKDAQFAEQEAASIRRIASMLNIPIGMLGMMDNEVATVEEDARRFLAFTLLPRTSRIEGAFAADADLFAGSKLRLRFDPKTLLRADEATQADIGVKKVQAGIWLPDEARLEDGLEPLPDGKGQIPQITPVGGKPNDSVAPPVQEEKARALAAAIVEAFR